MNCFSVNQELVSGFLQPKQHATNEHACLTQTPSDLHLKNYKTSTVPKCQSQVKTTFEFLSKEQ
jgi:hypothetical protein